MDFFDDLNPAFRDEEAFIDQDEIDEWDDERDFDEQLEYDDWRDDC